MDIGSIFLILALLIPVVIYLSRPLLETSPTMDSHSDQDISALLARRDQVVAAIESGKGERRRFCPNRHWTLRFSK